MNISIQKNALIKMYKCRTRNTMKIVIPYQNYIEY